MKRRHVAGWLAREARYKVAQLRRDIYVYQPTPQARRTLTAVLRDTFRRRT